MHQVCGLVAQQIAVCAGTEKRRIAGFFPLANGKGDARPESVPYLRDNLTYTLFREICVLATLQNKRPESQRIALCTAGEDILPAQPIPLYLSVAPADAAVIAVVPAVVGELDQSPDKYLRAVSFPADAGPPPETAAPSMASVSSRARAPRPARSMPRSMAVRISCIPVYPFSPLCGTALKKSTKKTCIYPRNLV